MRGPWVRGSKRVKPSLHIMALLHHPAPVAAPRPPYPGPNRRTEEKEGKQTHRALLGGNDSSASSFPSDPSEGSAHSLGPHCRRGGTTHIGRQEGLAPRRGEGQQTRSRLPGSAVPTALPDSPCHPLPLRPSPSRTALRGLPWTPHWVGQGSDAPAS